MPARPGLLSVLCILTMIGSGLMSLVCLVGIFASSWLIGMISGKVQEKAAELESNKSAMDSLGMSADDLHKGTEAASGLMAMGTGLFIAVFVIGLILNVLKFMGAMKMYGQKKSGFWMYMVPAFIVLLMCLISFQIIPVILLGLFIGGYFAVKKSLI